MTPVEQITSLYIGYFGRAPDPEGLNYWVGRFNDGFSLSEIAESFSVQAESQAKYPYLSNPNIASPQAFITQVYMNLFNRMPDAEGLAYWTAQLNDGMDVGDFILDVISGAVTDPDQQIIENKVEVGVDFALRAANEPNFVYNDSAAAAAAAVIDGVDETEASVEAAKVETSDFFAQGPIGDVFTLTTGLDQISGTTGVDTFQAVQGAAADTTINTFDDINGGAGRDTLNIVGAGGTDINANASFEGVEELWQIGANGAVTVESDVTAGFRNSATLSTVTVADGGASASVALDDVATAQTVTIDETTADDVTSVTVSGDVAGAGAVTVDTSATTAVETVNLGLTSDGIVTLTVDNAVVTTVNASASTGDLTIDASAITALETLVGGSGDDVLTADNGVITAATVAINGGAGDDAINFDIDSSAAAVASTLVGGAGGDVFALTGTAGNLFDAANEADLTESLVTISDFGPAVDVIDLSGLALGARATQNLVNAAASGEDNLFDAVTAVAGVTADGDYAIFEFGGDTYIYAETGLASGLDADDVLIQVTGTSVSEVNASNFIA